MNKPLFLFLFISVLPSLAKGDCACPEAPPPVTALKQSTTAFIGSPNKIQKSPIKEGYVSVEFAIMKRLKGFDEIKSETVTVFTPESPDNCGFPFTDGQDYVVFAQGNPAGLRTTSCQGTGYLDNMKADVDALIKLAEPYPAVTQ